MEDKKISLLQKKEEQVSRTYNREREESKGIKIYYNTELTSIINYPNSKKIKKKEKGFNVPTTRTYKTHKGLHDYITKQITTLSEVLEE